MSNNRETANKEKNPNKTKIGKEDVTWFIPPNTKKRATAEQAAGKK